MLVATAIQLRSPTDSIAKDYVYEVSARIHGEPFSGKFYWSDDEQQDVVDCEFLRGNKGYALMESDPGGDLNVIYKVPIFVKHHTEERIIEVCISYSSENLRFSMDEQENLTYLSGGNSTVPLGGESTITKITEE